jgi:nucleoside-diphosphate-sugar epimerase
LARGDAAVPQQRHRVRQRSGRAAARGGVGADRPLPQASCGAQKLASETLIADYTRKGFVDGRVVRLMTVAIRPGPASAAASGFISSIIREPLAGLEAQCPVPADLTLAIVSPRATIPGILAVAEAVRGPGPGQMFGGVPVNLPALTVTAAQMIAALAAVAGDTAASRVRMRRDPTIAAIVASWPARFDCSRAAALGIQADRGIGSVIGHDMADHAEALVGN